MFADITNKSNEITNNKLRFFLNHKDLPFGGSLRGALSSAVPPVIVYADMPITDGHIAAFLGLGEEHVTPKRLLTNIEIITLLLRSHPDDQVLNIQPKIVAASEGTVSADASDEDCINFVCGDALNDAVAALLHANIVSALKRSGKRQTKDALSFIEDRVEAHTPADSVTQIGAAISKALLGGLQDAEDGTYQRKNTEEPGRELEERELQKCGKYKDILPQSLAILAKDESVLWRNFNRVIRQSCILGAAQDPVALREDKIKYALGKLALSLRYLAKRERSKKSREESFNHRYTDWLIAANHISDQVFSGAGTVKKIGYDKIAGMVESTAEQLFDIRTKVQIRELQDLQDLTTNVKETVQGINDIGDQDIANEARARLEQRIYKIREAVANIQLFDEAAESVLANDEFVDISDAPSDTTVLFDRFKKHTQKLRDRAFGSEDPRSIIPARAGSIDLS